MSIKSSVHAVPVLLPHTVFTIFQKTLNPTSCFVVLCLLKKHHETTMCVCVFPKKNQLPVYVMSAFEKCPKNALRDMYRLLRCLPKKSKKPFYVWLSLRAEGGIKYMLITCILPSLFHSPFIWNSNACI